MTAATPERDDASKETQRNRRRRAVIPASLGWLLAAVFVLGVGWALATPPWQAPDENSHFGYLQHLAETGELPGQPDRPSYSSEQRTAARISGSDQVAALKQGRPIWTAVAQREANSAKLARAPRDDGGGPNPAASNPPLYYLSVAPAYLLARDSTIFTRLEAARLLGLGWLLVTVLGTWLLAGELLGKRRSLQLLAAAVAGLVPMVTFVSASVTPDSALYALWTLALWLGVRVIRSGASTPSAAALAATTAAAILVKSTSYALLPGVALALTIGLWRTRQSTGVREAVRAGAVAAAAMAAPLLVWWLVAAGLDRASTGQLAGASTNLDLDRLREFGSYVWQFYLPRLPFQNRYETFIPNHGVWEFWVKGTWGEFGWLEVRLPVWTYWLTAIASFAAIIGAIAALIRARHRLDLAVVFFIVLVVGTLIGGLHWTDYNDLEAGQRFMQGRYILPLIGLAGVTVGASFTLLPVRARHAATGATLGALLLLQFFSIGTVLTRFYA